MFVELAKVTFPRDVQRRVVLKPHWANIDPRVLLGFSSMEYANGDSQLNGTCLVYAGYTVLIAETIEEFKQVLELNNFRLGRTTYDGRIKAQEGKREEAKRATEPEGQGSEHAQSSDNAIARCIPGGTGSCPTREHRSE